MGAHHDQSTLTLGELVGSQDFKDNIDHKPPFRKYYLCSGSIYEPDVHWPSENHKPMPMLIQFAEDPQHDRTGLLMELDICKLLADEACVFLPAEVSPSSSVLRTRYVKVINHTPTKGGSLPEGRLYLSIAYSGIKPLPVPQTTHKVGAPPLP